MIIYSHLRDTLEADQLVSVAITSPCVTPLSILRLIHTFDQDTEINLLFKNKCIFNYRSIHSPTEFIHFPLNLQLALYQSFRLEVRNLIASPTDTCICFVWQEYFK